MYFLLQLVACPIQPVIQHPFGAFLLAFSPVFIVASTAKVVLWYYCCPPLETLISLIKLLKFFILL